MLLPHDPNLVVKLFLTVDPKRNAPGLFTLVLGPKVSNPNMHRNINNWNRGKSAPTKQSLDKFIYAVADAQNGSPEETQEILDRVREFDPESVLQSGHWGRWDAAVWGLRQGQLTKEIPAAEWCLSEAQYVARLSHKLEQILAQDQGEYQRELNQLPFSETATVRWVVQNLNSVAELEDIVRLSVPLISVTMMYLFAGLEGRVRPEKRSEFIRFMPTRDRRGRIESPTRRWLSDIQSLMGFDTQKEPSEALFRGVERRQQLTESEQRELKAYWAWSPESREVPSASKFDRMIKNAKACCPSVQSELDLRRQIIPLVFLFENLTLAGDGTKASFPDYDPLLPFQNFERLFEHAFDSAARERATA